MPLCVCGHSRYAHLDGVMSVPLVNPNPIYKVLPVVRVHPTANYDHQPCWCGCDLFQRDPEAS